MIKHTLILFLAGIILNTAPSFAQEKQADAQEYVLKAAFIYRFTDYVAWEENSASIFSIAILGDSEITPWLLELTKGKSIKNKRIYIKQFNNLNDIPVNAYQIIFVSKNYADGIESVVSKVAGSPVLVIAEQKGAAEKGATINFLISNNKLKFEVNMKAANKPGLKIGSQLLQHAILVNMP